MTERLRAWMRTHPAARDALIAATWLIAGVVTWQLGAYRMWAPVAVADIPPWVFLLTLGGMVAAVTQRSRLPFLALAAGGTIAGVDLLCGGSLGVVLALTDLIYAAVKYGSAHGVRITIRTFFVGAGAAIATLIIVRPADPAVAAVVLQWLLIIAVSGLWGWNVRSEGERTRSLLGEQHAWETSLLRDRIAHDLHDLVANQIAVAGLHVEAAKLQAERLGGDTAPLAVSLERAKQGTDHAHEQLRKLISVLSAAEAHDVPGRVGIDEGLARLDRLLPAGRALLWEDDARAQLHESLTGADEAQAIIVLRVLEELVMNAAKHSSGNVTARAARSDTTHRESAPASPALSIELSNTVHGICVTAVRGTGIGLRGATLLLDSVSGELATRNEDGVWIAHLFVPHDHREAHDLPHKSAPAADIPATMNFEQ